MSETQLIEAVKGGAPAAVKEAIASGADLNEQDEQGWTPLCWAAARGDAALVALLLDAGADATRVGRDQRTAFMIAQAAGRAEAAALLKEGLRKAGVERGGLPERAYCRAYPLEELRRFPGWPEGGDEAEVVFLHHDLTVTRSVWRDSGVVFDGVTPEWREFVSGVLDFHAPDASGLSA
ncbi:MAG TPA: ankyrin repeat domain-containing protein [Pyrinomonadaceae bacterium]|jgi:ankyrin repeat protein|nr:ankyrin repeat domain-containing protein [Pyrinomonadaceae bacterium]